MPININVQHHSDVEHFFVRYFTQIYLKEDYGIACHSRADRESIFEQL